MPEGAAWDAGEATPECAGERCFVPAKLCRQLARGRRNDAASRGCPQGRSSRRFCRGGGERGLGKAIGESGRDTRGWGACRGDRGIGAAFYALGKGGENDTVAELGVCCGLPPVRAEQFLPTGGLALSGGRPGLFYLFFAGASRAFSQNKTGLRKKDRFCFRLGTRDYKRNVVASPRKMKKPPEVGKGGEENAGRLRRIAAEGAQNERNGAARNGSEQHVEQKRNAQL